MQEPQQPSPAQGDLHDAWRLAYVVVADADLATRAVTKAFLGPELSEPSAIPRVDLLATTLRVSLTRAAERPPEQSDSAVITALWQLAPEQRAALWLAQVNELDDPALGTVLGLTSINAGHVASRAAEWLDVALDQESGPLCPREPELDDYIHDRLPAAEANDMKAHVPECSTCSTKARAFEELADLKSVLSRAVPEPPPGLTMASLEDQERADPASGPATLVEPGRRTPAVRPLFVCCVALIILGVVGIVVVRPAKAGDPPPASTDPSAVVPGSTNNGAAGGAAGSSANLPPPTATTVTVTTSSLPVLTFPTAPAGGRRSR